MFNILNAYLDREEYYIIIMKNNIYIKGYNKLINISNNEILIEINHQIYKINGLNFSLKKSISSELFINGEIESVKKI